jgi:FkbM family methyltransferase
LATNLSLNSQASWALPFGVGRASGETTLSICDERVGNSGAQIHEITDNVVASATIPVIALDDFLALYPARTPIILKVDIDGREVDVIKGARKTLAAGRIKSLLIEFDNADLQAQVEDIILPLGYVPDETVNGLPNHSTKRRVEKGSTIRNKVYKFAS